MVNGGNHRNSFLLQLQNAIAQALVVMDDVVIRFFLLKVLNQPPAKRIGFWESTCQHAEPFKKICVREQMFWTKGKDMVF